MRDFIKIVTGSSKAERLDEMPARRRGLQPSRDLPADDTHGRITHVHGELMRLMGLARDRDATPPVYDGEFADMDRPVLPGPQRALAAPMADDEFATVDGAEIIPPPSETHAAPFSDTIKPDDPALPARESPRGALATSSDYEPRWMKIGDMPLKFRLVIIAYASALFASVTDTPIEDIRVLSSLTHSRGEADALEANIRAEGVRQDSETMSITGPHQMISNVERYHWHGWDTLITRDPGGTHVFAWPETRRLGAPARGRGLPAPAPRRLR